MNRREFLTTGCVSLTIGASGCSSGLNDEEIGTVLMNNDYYLVSEYPGPINQTDFDLVEYTLVERGGIGDSELVIIDEGGEEFSNSDFPVSDVGWVKALTKAVPRHIDPEDKKILKEYVADVDTLVEVDENVEEVSNHLSTLISNEKIINTINKIDREITTKTDIISPFQDIINEADNLGVLDEYLETVENFDRFVNQVREIEDLLSWLAERTNQFLKPHGPYTYAEQNPEVVKHTSIPINRDDNYGPGVLDGIRLFEIIEETTEINWLYVAFFFFPDKDTHRRKKTSDPFTEENFEYPHPIGTSSGVPASITGGLISDVNSILTPLIQLKEQFVEIAETAANLSQSLVDIQLPGSAKLATVCGLLGTLSLEVAARVEEYYNPLTEVYKTLSTVHWSANRERPEIS